MVIMMRPRVIKLAETKVDRRAVQKLMQEYGKPAISWLWGHRNSWSSDGEALIEISGRVCYRSFGVGLNPNITKVRSESKEYFRNVIQKGDGSILEHATVSFALMWVSRVFTHELVRHRVGTAFSQESLRFVRTTSLPFTEWDGWVPAEFPKGTKEDLLNALKGVEHHYQRMIAKIPWEKMNFDEKKRVTSALRRILPQGMATVIIFTANHRTLRWLIEMRTHPSAEIEIRKIFGLIAEMCIQDYPLIYSDFKRTTTRDGLHSYAPTLRSKV